MKFPENGSRPASDVEAMFRLARQAYRAAWLTNLRTTPAAVAGG
jgi:hypothetical protein